jgi:phage gpG-like protein
MYRVTIKCDNTRALRRLEAMDAAAKDFRIVFQWARTELAKANAANFSASGLPVGGWSPLKPRYAAWKSRNFPGSPIMVQGGALRRDLTTLRGPANEIRRTSAKFGTSIEYAKFHQYGTTRMAKRQIVFEPPLFAKQLAEQAKKHIVDAANGARRRRA